MLNQPLLARTMFYVYTISQYDVDSCSDVFRFFLTMQIVVTVLFFVTDKFELYHVRTCKHY